MEWIDRMPYIRTVQIGSDALLEDYFAEALDSGDLEKWICVTKTAYMRDPARGLKTRPLTPEARRLEKEIRHRLEEALGKALSVPEEEMAAFIRRRLEEF